MRPAALAVFLLLSGLPPGCLGAGPEVDYPDQTAVAGSPFQGRAPFVPPGLAGSWRLLEPSPGWRLDGETGALSWDAPAPGEHRIRLRFAGPAGRTQDVSARLSVFKIALPDPVVSSTRHVDFIADQHLSHWFARMRPGAFIDAAYRSVVEMAGTFPRSGRQAVAYDPDKPSSRATSGRPVRVGRDFWLGNKCILTLALLAHEVGHNLGFEDGLPTKEFWPAFDGYFHHGTSLFEVYAAREMDSAPASVFQSDVLRDYFRYWHSRHKEQVSASYAELKSWAAKGGSSDDFPGDREDAFRGFLYELAGRHGQPPLKIIWRMLRQAVAGGGIWDGADSEGRRRAVFFAAASSAVGEDLADRLRRDGWSFDHEHYRKVLPAVGERRRLLAGDAPREDAGRPFFEMAGYRPVKDSVLKCSGRYLSWRDGRLALSEDREDALRLFVESNGSYTYFLDVHHFRALNAEADRPPVDFTPHDWGWHSAQWTLEERPSGYRIRNRWRKKYLAISPGSGGLELQGPSGGEEQSWEIEKI